jgi:endo-1,4-beta-xylanase
MSRPSRAHGVVAAIVLAMACGRSRVEATPATTLKAAFHDAFRVGAAVNANQFSERDARGAALVKTQFNTITPENVLKWEAVHPQPGTYDFAAPDQYVAFGERNGMFVIGHTLVWHSQTPRWVFQDASGKLVSRDTLLGRMRDHIHTVVGRYKGRINGWDVVNEALNEDGTLRRSLWLTIIGDDYIAKAFEFAHEADPGAELYYNDYSVENAAKRNGAVKLITKLKAEGVPVTAIGLQGHDKLDWPTPAQEDSTIVALARLGVKVNITELDVDVLPPAVQNRTADVNIRAELDPKTNPYAGGLPDSMQHVLAARYAALFEVFLKHRDVIDRVTFWGVGDGDSWLNNWPVRGRVSYPLLFDAQDNPKPAFDAVIRTARQARERR